LAGTDRFKDIGEPPGAGQR